MQPGLPVCSWLLVVALIALTPCSVFAQARGNSGLPPAPGNPIADLQGQVDAQATTIADPQRQINALTNRLTTLENALTSPAAVTVDCGAGQTIADALHTVGTPLTITVVGTCNENVTIARDDVTLMATPPKSGKVNGLNLGPNGISTITVTGARVTIDGLEVTGGSNGILGSGASRLTVQNCSVHDTGRTGVVYFQGSDGTLDGCEISANPRDGVAVEGGVATIIRNNIHHNTRHGVLMSNGASGRLGIDNLGQIAFQSSATFSNDISFNGSAGVLATVGGTGFVGGNRIANNGTDLNSTVRDGVQIFQAQLDFVGGNLITANAGSGVLVVHSKAIIGDIGFGLPTGSANTITGNGAGVPNSAGVLGFLNSPLDIRNATIQGNSGNGVSVNLQSTARLAGGTITDNTGSDVQLVNGSGAQFQAAFGLPLPVLTPNTGGSVVCVGTEASVAGLAPPLPDACTGF